jgi:hypothetical protein
LTLAGVAALAACQTERVSTSDGRPMPPEPRAAPAAPAGAKANAVALLPAAKPQDTNGNAFPDLLLVDAYLFAEPHPAPIFETGAFVFVLHHEGRADLEGAEPIAQWRIDGAKLDDCRAVTLWGRGYSIPLSLLEGSGPGERFPLIAATLACRFEPADGRGAIEPRGVYSVQLGSSLVSGDSQPRGR